MIKYSFVDAYLSLIFIKYKSFFIHDTKISTTRNDTMCDDESLKKDINCFKQINLLNNVRL